MGRWREAASLYDRSLRIISLEIQLREPSAWLKTSTWSTLVSGMCLEKVKAALSSHTSIAMKGEVLHLASNRATCELAAGASTAQWTEWLDCIATYGTALRSQAVSQGHRSLEAVLDDEVTAIRNTLRKAHNDLWNWDIADFYEDDETETAGGDRVVRRHHRRELEQLWPALGKCDGYVDLSEVVAHFELICPAWLAYSKKLPVEQPVFDLLLGKLGELNAVAGGDYAHAAGCLRDLPRKAWLVFGRCLSSSDMARIYIGLIRYAILAGDDQRAVAELVGLLSVLGDRRSSVVTQRAFDLIAERCDALDCLQARCAFLKMAIREAAVAHDELSVVDAGRTLDSETVRLCFALHFELISQGRFLEAQEVETLLESNVPFVLSMTRGESELSQQVEGAVSAWRVEVETRQKRGESVWSSAMAMSEGWDIAAARSVAHNVRESLQHRPDSLFLHYVVHPEGATVVSEAEGRVDLDVRSGRMVNRFVFNLLTACMEDRPEQLELLQQAYKLFFGPIAHLLEDETRVVIAASGALRAIPWCALHDGHHYLVNRLSCVSAGPDVPDLLEPPPRYPVALACAFAGPEDEPEARGAAVLSETADLRKYLEVSNLNGPDATAQAVLQRLLDVDILHVAGHFHVPAARPAESAFVAEDGSRLPISQLLQGRLDRLQLAVLSGCTTNAVSGHLYGKRGHCVHEAFFSAGCRSVLTTLWPVVNGPTRAFMSRFYTGLAGGLAKDVALAHAQRAFISGEIGHGAYSSPLFWAPYALAGNWLPFPRASDASPC